MELALLTTDRWKAKKIEARGAAASVEAPKIEARGAAASKFTAGEGSPPFDVELLLTCGNVWLDAAKRGCRRWQNHVAANACSSITIELHPC